MTSISMKESLKILEKYSKYAKNLKLIPKRVYNKFENVFTGNKRVRNSTVKNLIEEVKEKLDNHFYFKNEISNLGNLAVEPKKQDKKTIVEFTLDLFILVSDSKYDTKDDSKVYIIDGKHYKKLNGNDFRFVGDVKFYRDIRRYGLIWLKNRDNYKVFMQLLFKINFHKAFEFQTVISKLSISTDIAFIEIFDVRMVLENKAPLNFENVEVFHDSKAINFKYISYEIEMNSKTNNYIRSVYKTDYVNNNFLPESCFISLLLDNFKDSVEQYWNRYNKKRYLTYETLYKMIYPNKELQKSHNGASFSAVRDGFFEPLKIEAYLFDITYNIQAYYKPEIKNKNFNSTLYLLYHNNHIYHMDTNIKRLEQIRDQYFKVKEDEIIREPSVSYTIIHKEVDGKTYLKIENIQQLIDVIKDESLSGEIEVLYQKNITELYFELYFYKEMCYSAMPYMKDGNNILSFRLNNIGNKQICVYNYDEEDITENQIFDNIDSLKNYEIKKSNVMKQLLTRNYISSYSDNVQTLLYNNVIGGVIGDFRAHTQNCYKLDFNRYYTSILNSLSSLPVINSFDEFITYNGEEIEDYNLYYLKKIGDRISYPMKRFNICYGMNIKGISDIEIISVLKVSKLKSNKSQSYIKEIYKDESLTNQQKKDLFNCLIGKYDKKDNKSYFCSISQDELEINSFLKQYGGEKYSVMNDNKVLYFNVLHKKQILNEGFKPISLLIKDIANKKLFQLKDEIESVGLQTYGCNTDCIYFEKNNDKFDLFKKRYKSYFDFTDKNDYDAIGKLKFEDVEKPNNKLLEVKENIDVYVPYVEPLINHIELKDEFNKNEIKEIIDNCNKLIIKADIAGAGKTSSFRGKSNCLIICPYNALCFELSRDGENSITLNKLIGLRYDGDKNVDMKGFDVSDIESIVFDEIYLYPTNLLEKIKKYMNNHTNIRFYATGDEYQLDPIETLNIQETKEYYNKIILSMFPNQIILHENKRCNTTEDRRKMKMITTAIRESSSKEDALNIVMKYFKKIYRKEEITTNKNVVGLNRTSDWINEYLHKYSGDNKYYLGLELIGRKSFKNKNCNIKVNYTYTIVKMLEKAIILSDGDEEHIIENELIEKIFKLNYSRTCHSLQGLSVDEGITIFDIFNPFVGVNWIYTAITRATQLDNIYIYCAKENTVDFLKLNETIRSRIQGHMEYDKQKELRSLLLTPSLKGGKGDNIPLDYITINWVKDKLFQTKKCKYCERRFDYNDNESWSIDRLDNYLSHTKENCQIICRRCNNGKK